MPAMLMEHSTDPAEVIRKGVGDLSKFKLFGNQVLLGVYMRPDKTKSGLYISDQTRAEDGHQGKAGLVLMRGPSAFVSDEHYDFKGLEAKIGDWVALWVSDGRSIKINGTLCRIAEDQHIRMVLGSSPDSIF